MSLDFAILGPDRRVQEEVRVELSEHSIILDVAIALQCTMYLRVRGFWDRVLYDHHDLPLFAAELQDLHDSVPHDVRHLIADLQQIVSKAIATNKVIHALPD